MTWLVFAKDIVSAKHIHLNTSNAKQLHERWVMEKSKAGCDLAMGEEAGEDQPPSAAAPWGEVDVIVFI